MGWNGDGHRKKVYEIKEMKEKIAKKNERITCENDIERNTEQKRKW